MARNATLTSSKKATNTRGIPLSIALFALRPPPMQEGLDERLKRSIEHSLNIARLVPSAEILHQLEGLHGVGPDLSAP